MASWWTRPSASATDYWEEAFHAHPRIGEQARDGHPAAAWSRAEQGGVAGAAAADLERLAAANRAYEDRFGHIFIVFASGKTPAEMLGLLEQRMGNEAEEERAVAAAEQAKITRLRLHKMMGVAPGPVRLAR